MRTIESRRFVAGGQELRLFLVEEKEHRLPFRVRLRHSSGKDAKTGVLAGVATLPEAEAVLDEQSKKATAAGWTQVPGQVRLALEIPAAPGSAPPGPPPPTCLHEAIAAYLPKLAPGKSIVCPDCAATVKQ